MHRRFLETPWLGPLSRRVTSVAAAVSMCLGGCAHAPSSGSPTSHAAAPESTRLAQPNATRSGDRLRVDHITIVIMENKGYDSIVKDKEAPYINSLADGNVSFTNSYAVTHPSEPNYLALYSGSTHGLASDACPLNFTSPSLGGELVRAHKSIRGYMEDLPAVGSTVCADQEYVRKHDPLIDFSDTPPQSVVPYSQLATDIASNTYPSVAFVVPNLIHDMHDGTVAMGDQWLATNLPAILAYDANHHGVVLLTWDEDDRGEGNHIPTIAAGPMLTPGKDDQRIDHYAVLATVTDLFGLPPLDGSAPVDRLVHSSGP